MIFAEKLYLNEHSNRSSFELKPSEQFCRFARWNSPPIITLSIGVYGRLADAYWPMWKELGYWRSLLRMSTREYPPRSTTFCSSRARGTPN